MNVKIREIYDFIDRIAPYELQMSFDNSGLIIGDADDEFTKALLAMDVTDAVIDEALREGANLIITHHPVIFNPIKRISSKSLVYRLIQNGIGCLSAHTNLDIADGGVNTCLAQAIGLSNIAYTGIECMYTGTLEHETSAHELAEAVRDALGCEGLRFADGGRKIKTVAVSSGAGGRSIYDAARLGADTLVTGEIKHHEILDAVRLGVTVIDAGHYKSEDVVFEPLIERLKSEFPDMEFIKSRDYTDGIDYV